MYFNILFVSVDIGVHTTGPPGPAGDKGDKGERGRFDTNLLSLFLQIKIRKYFTNSSILIF